MSLLTPELSLVQAVDDDDTADYLTLPEGLAGSLSIIDGLFNATTGHHHNGAHQGGNLTFLDFEVGEDLNVLGASTLHGAVHCYSTLRVDGATTLASTLDVTAAATLGASLDVLATSRLRGNVTADANLTVGVDLSVLRDLTVGRNTAITGTLTISGALSAAGLTISGSGLINGVLNVGRLITGGYDRGASYGAAIAGAALVQGFLYQRDNAAARVWDAVDFPISTGNTANAAVIRDGNGAISDPKIVNNISLGVAGGTYTFPSVTGNAGLWRYIKAWTASVIMNLTNGTLIFGNTQYTSGQYTLAQGDSLSCYCDGANWWVV